MKARRLIDGASFGPDVAKAMVKNDALQSMALGYRRPREHSVA
jgi:hypothetical protein